MEQAAAGRPMIAASKPSAAARCEDSTSYHFVEGKTVSTWNSWIAYGFGLASPRRRRSSGCRTGPVARIGGVETLAWQNSSTGQDQSLEDGRPMVRRADAERKA